MQTIIGFFRSVAEANQAKQALASEGYSNNVRVIDQSESGYDTGNQSGYDSGYQTNTLSGSGSSSTTGDTGVGAKIKHFFSELVGHDDEETHRAYTEGISRGGALVAVSTNAGDEDRIADLLEQYGATEIEGDNGQTTGYAANTGSAATIGTPGAGTGTTNTGNIIGEQVIPVVQEELVVGKRAVQRGGVRVFSRVVSEPVSESVSLHDESVVVDRRAVDRPATAADFTDAGPVEVIATGEEAVVGKTGRVVEEVVVGKTATDRTETVEDSVRRTEVDVEPVRETTSTSRSGY